MHTRKLFKIALYVFILVGFVLSFIAPWISHLIETGYSQAAYLWMIKPLSLFTGLFPFSVAEFMLIGLFLVILYKAAQSVKNLIDRPRALRGTCKKIFVNSVVVLATLYLGFNMLYGLNYSRLPFAELAALPLEPTSVGELTELAVHLAERGNTIRELVAEDERGVMTLPGGIREMFDRAELGYENAAMIYPKLGGGYGRPKGIIFSRLMSYSGITGVYFPFTAEANVNIDLPHFWLPATTTHEMAHQRGFAREEEANYIAYLTGTLHPDVDFQYSGVMLALIHTMNALHPYDPEAYNEVRSKYSEGMDRDMRDLREYWAQFEGPVKKTSTRLNHTYLKANRQQDGVHSYGRMVDLLLAEYRTGKMASLLNPKE